MLPQRYLKPLDVGGIIGAIDLCASQDQAALHAIQRSIAKGNTASAWARAASSTGNRGSGSSFNSSMILAESWDLTIVCLNFVAAACCIRPAESENTMAAVMRTIRNPLIDKVRLLGQYPCELILTTS